MSEDNKWSCNFVFSTLTHDSPMIFDDWFKYKHEVHDHSTRASTNVISVDYFSIGQVENTFSLQTQGSENNYGAKMIQTTGPLIWNDIPDDIQRASTLFTFKKELKQHLFSQYEGEASESENERSYANRNINPHSNFSQRWRQNVNQPFVSRWDH